jgi:hypothetical protein
MNAIAPRETSDAQEALARLAAIGKNIEGLRNRLYGLHETVFGPQPQSTDKDPGGVSPPIGFLPTLREELAAVEASAAEASKILDAIERQLRL